MKKRIALLIILIAGIFCLPGIAENLPESGSVEGAERLPDKILMTFFENTIFAGDSQVAKFRNFVKVKMAADPGYFSGVDFRAMNSYKFMYAAHKYPQEKNGAHLTDEGLDVTLYDIVKKKHPGRVFMLAGLNDAFTTDYTERMQGVDETGYDRAARYVREMTGLIREVSPETEIYIVSQMPVTRTFEQGINKYEAVRDRFDLVNETVRQECETLGIHYVDLASGLKDEEGLLPDKYCIDEKMHLNDDGYEIFARELLDFAQAEYENGNWDPFRNNTGEE